MILLLIALLDLAELVKVLEKKFGVSASAPVMAALAAPASAEASAGKEEKYGSFGSNGWVIVVAPEVGNPRGPGLGNSGGPSLGNYDGPTSALPGELSWPSTPPNIGTLKIMSI